MICNEKHIDIKDIINLLPDGQVNEGERKCPACAFEQGYNDALVGKRRNFDDVVIQLPKANSENYKNKSCELAYTKGFEIGSKIRESQEFACVVTNKRLKGFNIPKSLDVLQLYKIGNYVISVSQGKISNYDMVVKFRQYYANTQTWSLFRQPKHIHWTVDVLIKQEYHQSVINKFLTNLIRDWDDKTIIPHLTSYSERNDFLEYKKMLRFVFLEAEKYQDTNFRGEYPIAFLILISRILMTQERTNRADAYMFKGLLESLKEHKDLYTIIGKATFRGR